MKLVRFAARGKSRLGAVVDGGVIDLTERLGELIGSSDLLLREDTLAAARTAVSQIGPRIGLDEIEFLAPVPGGGRIFCVGINYPKIHPLGGQVAAPEFPQIFLKLAQSMVPHRGALQRPTISDEFDYEGELAVAIGREGFEIPAAEALSYVAGYTCFNDGSVRDYQRQGVTVGKNFVRSGGWGPWLVTADEIPDPAQLSLRTTLNGDLVQSAGLKEMFFSIPKVIEYLSRITPLLPGDLIATGSPEGSGASRNRFLRPGDRIDVEISGIGVLSNTVG
jgi:2-keto-4-pentenoate hydratase/2-oxohepta-3-ene-1,7-dioic acid hydratase in catechol pathway